MLLPGLGVILSAIGIPTGAWARAKAKGDAAVAANDAGNRAWDEATLTAKAQVAELGAARPVVPATPSSNPTAA